MELFRLLLSALTLRENISSLPSAVGSGSITPKPLLPQPYIRSPNIES